MDRRTFLHLSGLGALGALAGCAESTTRASDSGLAEADARIDDAHVADALAQVPDGGHVALDAGSAVFVLSSFSVMLNDSSCSGHDHGLTVSAGTYLDDSPIDFLGGSHLVRLRPSELVRLERGEQVPFATSGPGPGHGHCGLAWREGLFEPSRDRIDACEILPPESGPLATCVERPRA